MELDVASSLAFRWPHPRPPWGRGSFCLDAAPSRSRSRGCWNACYFFLVARRRKSYCGMDITSLQNGSGSLIDERAMGVPCLAAQRHTTCSPLGSERVTRPVSCLLLIAPTAVLNSWSRHGQCRRRRRNSCILHFLQSGRLAIAAILESPRFADHLVQRARWLVFASKCY